jgi:hypothetical protein
MIGPQGYLDQNCQQQSGVDFRPDPKEQVDPPSGDLSGVFLLRNVVCNEGFAFLVKSILAHGFQNCSVPAA